MSGGVPWLVAALVALAVALFLRPRPVLLRAPPETIARRADSGSGERAVLRRLRPLLATVAFAGGWAML